MSYQPLNWWWWTARKLAVFGIATSAIFIGRDFFYEPAQRIDRVVDMVDHPIILKSALDEIEKQLAQERDSKKRE